MVRLYNLTTERVKEPLAVKCENVRFGWKLDTDEKDVMQKSCKITVSLDGKTVWESAAETDETVDITSGARFLPGKKYKVEVISETTAGECRGESFFATEPEIKGVFIKPKKHTEGACVYFRRDFRCDKKIRRATAYVAGLGYGVLYVNGKRVDEVFFDAPFTNYEKEVLYRAYDITGILGEENCIGVHCGEGFYAQSRVWGNKAFKYGDICCFAQVNVEYEDGAMDVVYTEPGTWQTMYSPTVLSNAHGGEIYDARRETPDWCRYGFTDDELRPAVADTVPKGALHGAVMPPCRVIRRVKTKAVKQIHGADSGLWVFDMGENFAGTVTLRPPLSAEGSTYVLRFAETVDENGQLDYRSTGVYHVLCQQQHIYICSGKQNEEWTPDFCWHGFRYVELTGFYGREPQPDMIEGLAISTDFETTGTVRTSGGDFDRLQEIMLRTIRSNYHGYPEDCPAREKCGWLGDAEVVCDTAIYNFDMAASYEKYLRDIRTSRDVYGDWTMIAPGKRTCGFGTPLWGCAQVIIPYKLYKLCGDKAVLEENYAYMCDWIEHEKNRSDDLIISEGLGDWCPPIGNDGKRRIPVNHSSTFMFYETAVIMAEVSRVLCRDGGKFDELAEKIRDSINRHFYDKEKHSYGYQASNGAAWLLGVVPDGDRDALVKATHDMIVNDNYVMTTGIYGNKYLLPMLYENGLGEDAEKIMFGRGFFDFGTMMDDGATSLWECLEMKNIGMKGLVASYDHPMHSGFAYMYYAQLAGIKPAAPGFKEFVVSPCLKGAPDKVYAELDTVNGRIISDRDGNRLKVTVPANTRCTVKFGKNNVFVGSGTHTFEL